MIVRRVSKGDAALPPYLFRKNSRKNTVPVGKEIVAFVKGIEPRH